jgi:hypothetical protein
MQILGAKNEGDFQNIPSESQKLHISVLLSRRKW